FTFRLAPLAFDVLPDVEAENFGANPSVAQFVTWNGTSTACDSPSSLSTLPAIAIFAQFVGLNWKPLRVVVKLIFLICTGMPSIICGMAKPSFSALLVIVNAEVRGLTSIFARTTMQSQAGF